MSFRYKNVYLLWIAMAVVLVDQVSKQWIVRRLDWYQVEPILPHFNLVHMRNTGAAFSMMSSMPPVVFVLLGVAVSLFILWWMRRNPHGQIMMAAALTLIMGGALGNVIDRVTRGYVIDFVDFYVGRWHFAAFNVADSAITVGTGLLLLDAVLEQLRTRRSTRQGAT